MGLVASMPLDELYRIAIKHRDLDLESGVPKWVADRMTDRWISDLVVYQGLPEPVATALRARLFL